MLNKLRLGVRLLGLLGKSRKDERFFEDLEDILIEGDLGPLAAAELVDELRASVGPDKLRSEKEFMAALKKILSGMILVSDLKPEPGKLNFMLILGVNGVGKTTTIAKMAHYFRQTYKTTELVISLLWQN